MKSHEKRKASGFYSSERQSQRRKKQLETEEQLATRVWGQGYEVFSPTVVCDRIAVKDGKVFFVEFKRRGQSLRPGQQQIADLVGSQYLVVYE